MAWQLISVLKPKENKITFSNTFKGNLIRLSCSFIRPNEGNFAILRQVISRNPLTFFEVKKILLRPDAKEIIQLQAIEESKLTTDRSVAITTREDGWTIRLEVFREDV